MTQEDKDLLIKDLCARLPYGVKAKMANEVIDVTGFDVENDRVHYTKDSFRTDFDTCVEDIKPYLFPLSSMKEGQLQSLRCRLALNTSMFRLEDEFLENLYDLNNVVNRHSTIFDWLDAHHFDYRGLIDKGLAIVATNLNIY